MDPISNSVWQRKGSCVIFDQESLGPFIAAGALVSLRTFLGWRSQLPAAPPVPGKTVMVSGLETVLETLTPDDADIFLAQRIRPIIIELQNRWTDAGIVFGFTSHHKAFKETSLEEEVLFLRRDQKTIRLTEGLWDGSATINMKRLIREGAEPSGDTVIGYYVARIS
jgi:hypothetical protein